MEGKLSQRMADLARDLSSDDDPKTTLQHVVEASVELVDGCSSAGITLAQRDGTVRTSETTGEVHERLDELQQELQEGPCVDAVWQQRIVLVRDLGEEGRWPRWAARAAEDFGLGSMLSVQLFTHADRVGALNLFSRDRDAFDDDAIEEAVAIGAHAAVAVAAAESIENLQTALISRTLIGQATGLVMAQYQLRSGAAFALLRRLSSEQNRKLAVIAAELVETWDREGHF